ncbi:hypothetical protein SLE2022_266570 [Rubroshorea leprosula]
MGSWDQRLRFPALDIPITIQQMVTVMPAGPIPAVSYGRLYLSNLDDIIGERVFTPTVYFYRSGYLNPNRKCVIKTLRDAFAKVLVPYYLYRVGPGRPRMGSFNCFCGRSMEYSWWRHALKWPRLWETSQSQTQHLHP